MTNEAPPTVAIDRELAWRNLRDAGHSMLDKRAPLRVMFLLTSMPVGGAETLLVSLVGRLDRRSGVAPFVCSTEHLFHLPLQGVSHAEWPKDKHEAAPTETGSVICWPLTAVGIECAPPRATGLPQREKKL